MVIGRVSLIFLIYSSLLFLGTPPVLLALQFLFLVAATLVLLVAAFRQRTMVFPLLFIGFFLLFLVFLCVSMMLTVARGLTPAPIMLRFIQVFITTLALPLFAYGYNKLGILSYSKMMNHIIGAMLAYAVAKMIIYVVVGITHTDVVTLDLIFIKIFNTAPTTGGTAGTLFRFMAPADFMGPMVLYYLMVYRIGWFKWAAVVLLSVSLYGTVSRFVWLESAFALGLCFFSLSRGRMLALMFAGIILLPPIGIEVYPTLEQRFTDPGSAKSDALRLQQSEALTQDTDDHLLMGHGFGSYTYKMIRDFKAPYNYEVQWLEILYQMGLIGLLFTLGLLAFNAAPLLLSRSVEAIPVLLLFAFSLLSGFANPSLFGRTAAVGFALVYCFGQMIYDRAHMLACDDPPSDIAVGNPIPI